LRKERRDLKEVEYMEENSEKKEDIRVEEEDLEDLSKERR
jgi:hypothetical protein